jgi:lysine 6-dehydrogenase
MRFIVLGAGMQGAACAYDLLQHPDTEYVTLADQDPGLIEQVGKKLNSDQLRSVTIDCSDTKALQGHIKDHQVVVSALPYRLNLATAKAAIESGISFVDMGGNIETVLAELRLAKQARENDICLIPDCGLAPGLANVLVADAVAELEDITDVRIRVGGLPAAPRAPWDYMLVFSFEGLINEYTGSAAILRDWNRSEVDVLTEDEPIAFPDPVGDCEASFTSGGSSTLPWTFAGRIRNLDYKTVRYPGHYEKLRALRSLGFFDTETIQVRDLNVAPRDVLQSLMQKKLSFPNEPDVVVVRIESEGTRQGKPTVLCHEMMDYRDEETGLTAMMRTTAFPVSIVAQMIADGTIIKRGAFPPEMVVPPTEMISELERRGVFVRRVFKNK